MLDFTGPKPVAAPAKDGHFEEAELLAEEVNFPFAKHERSADEEGQKAIPKKSNSIIKYQKYTYILDICYSISRKSTESDLHRRFWTCFVCTIWKHFGTSGPKASCCGWRCSEGSGRSARDDQGTPGVPASCDLSNRYEPKRTKPVTPKFHEAHLSQRQHMPT